MSVMSLTDYVEQQFTAQQTLPKMSYQIALEVRNLKHKEDVGIEEVANLIYRDQMLTARILKVVNSVAYRGRETISTVKEGVLRLGINRIASFALLAAQSLCFEARSQQINRRIREANRKAYAAAICAHRVAECSTQNIDPEQAFLAALLRDVGTLQILQILDGLERNTDQTIALNDDAIDALITECHADISYRLMQQWQLPSRYTNIARHHESPGAGDMTPLMAVVRLIDQLLERIECPPDATKAQGSSALCSAEAHSLGLSDAHLEMLEHLLRDRLRKADDVL